MRIRRRGRLARRVVVFATAIALLVTASLPAGAATVLHVDQAHPDCDDTGPGSADQPLCTISAGAATAAAGDTVLVAAGIYDEQVNVARSGTEASPIVFDVVDGAGVTVQGQDHGFRLSSRSWVTIRGFKIVDTAKDGIYATGSSHLSIQGNEVAGAGEPILGQTARGIVLTSTIDSVVAGNKTHSNSDAGIFLGTGATGNLIAGNTSSKNARGYVRAAVGIDVRGGSNTVTANVTFDNEDSGINIWDGAHTSLVTNNVSYRNGDHGIDNKGSNNTRILSNTVYGGVDSGIEVVNSTGVTLANNISVDNGLNSPGTKGNIRVDPISAPTISLDYDLVYLSKPGVMIDFDGKMYGSLAGFVTATGREDNGLEGDPKFKSAATGNFVLTLGSPAIDSANSGVASHPQVDAKGRTRRDDPDTKNTGAGPRTFDDRGAYEFHPK